MVASGILADPSKAVKAGSWGISFQETGYGNTGTDKRLIGTIEYDETVVSEELLTKFINKFSYHSFTIITDTKALELCNTWYPSEDTPYFTIDSGNLVDNRPMEGI